MTKRSILLPLLLATLFAASTVTFAFAAANTPNFHRQNAAEEKTDPENTKNDVIRVITTTSFPAGSGSVSRKLTTKNLKITDLRNMLSVKYFFVDRTCSGGSPRFQIAVSTNGDNVSDGNAFGYLGDQAFGGGCPADVWTHEDMTNDAPKWELAQFTPSGGFVNTWAQVEAYFTTNHPDHKIVGCVFADDSGSFAPTTIGIAYYDNIQCYDRILEDAVDVVAGSSGF